MAKQSFKIQKFTQGTYTVTGREDMEGLGEASVYSQNIESVSEKGLLKGVDGDMRNPLSSFASAWMMDTLDSHSLVVGEQVDSKDVVFYDKTDGWLKVIKNFYNTV